jgi:hypothetical protein
MSNIVKLKTRGATKLIIRASFKTLRTYRLKEGPGMAFYHEHGGECPKIQKYAFKELKMPIFNNTSPSVYFFLAWDILSGCCAIGSTHKVHL